MSDGALHMRIMTASSPEYHLDYAGEHLRLWRDGDQLQDHVSHAAMRFTDGLNVTRADMRVRRLSAAAGQIDRRGIPVHEPDYCLVSSSTRRPMASRLKPQSEPTLKAGSLPRRSRR